MLPRADIAGTRPVAAIEAAKAIIPTGDARQELSQRLNRVELGTFFEASILSRMNDGSFVVKLADTAVRMNLPAGTQVGEKVGLTLVAKEPHPVFVQGTPRGDNTTSLSNAGRLIDWILHAAQNEGAPAALVGKTPLVSSADTAPGQLANAMKDTLAFSGLFYESHLEQWVNGERPLLSLMLEPQAKNSNLQRVAEAIRAAASAGSPPANDIDKQSGSKTPVLNTAQLARLLASLSEQPDAAHALRNLMRAVIHADTKTLSAEDSTAQQADVQSPAADAMPSAASSANAANAPGADELLGQLLSATHSAPDMHDAALSAMDNHLAAAMNADGPQAMSNESVRTVNLQLNTLEQQRVMWQGELWPGQQIEWEISDDTPRGKGADTEERSWQSVIRFELPTLGKVSAAVRLSGERLQIQVRAASETTASLLRAHGDALTSALNAAGSSVELLTVKRDESI